GIERDQPLASSQRLLEPTEREQRSHQDGQCLGRPRPQLDRLAQELVSVPRTALLISNEAEQMQRIELARVAREHGTIDRPRVVDLAHPMQRFSLVDGRHRKADVLAVTAARPSLQMIATFVRTDTPRDGLQRCRRVSASVSTTEPPPPAAACS